MRKKKICDFDDVFVLKKEECDLVCIALQNIDKIYLSNKDPDHVNMVDDLIKYFGRHEECSKYVVP